MNSYEIANVHEKKITLRSFENSVDPPSLASFSAKDEFGMLGEKKNMANTDGIPNID